jgi:hypothetical protein
MCELLKSRVPSDMKMCAHKRHISTFSCTRIAIRDYVYVYRRAVLVITIDFVLDDWDSQKFAFL